MADIDLNLVDNSLVNDVHDVYIVANIVINNIANTNTVFAENAVFHLSLDEIANSNTVHNETAVFHLSTNRVINTNTLHNPLIAAIISSLTVINSSSGVMPIAISFESTPTSIDTVTNTNTIHNLDGVYLSFLKTINRTINTNTIHPIIIGKDFTVVSSTVSNINYIPDPIVLLENITYKGVLKRRATINRPKNFKFKFSDISFDMFPHPLTGDIPVLYDVDAINQSINNIIRTRTFERPFSSYNISSKINELLFELSGALLVNELKNVIFNAIVNSEPRIILYEIKVTNLPETNSVSIQVYYQIRTVDTIEKFETVLTRT
jgi:phage baseplate assembly protein W